MNSDTTFRGILGFGIGVCFDVLMYFSAVSWIGGGDGVYTPLYFLISPFGFGFLIWPIAGALVFAFSSRRAMLASAGLLVCHHLGFIAQAIIWNTEVFRDVGWMWWIQPGRAFATIFFAVAWPTVLWAGVTAYYWKTRGN